MRDHVIAESDIPNIGGKLKQLLIANGIQTAADVQPNRIQRIGGFGPDRTANLLAWRESVAASFRFDPSTGISDPHRRDLDHKYRRSHEAIMADIERTVQNLENLDGWANQQIMSLIPELRSALAEWVVAKANLDLMDSPQ